MKYLFVIAPDAEWKIEGEFKSIDEAWERNDNMGSRWFFYPFRLVATNPSINAKIVSCPDKLFEGKKVKTFLKALSNIKTDEDLQFVLETGNLI